MAKAKDPNKEVKKDVLTEEEVVFHEHWTKQDCKDHLKQFLADHRAKGLSPYRYVTRNYYRSNSGVADSTWNRYFGTFAEFRRQSKLELNRYQHSIEKQIAKHASVEHYKSFDVRHNWGEDYIRENNNRFKTILFASDLHDVEVDPFYLRTLIDTAKRAQPDVISLVGDVFDFYEFSGFTKDPREFKPVERMKFVHERILEPLRTSCPNAQIDLLEGNHEARLLRILADSTPALKVILSDLHGMSISDLIGLKKYEVNYIAKADLSVFSKRDFTKEIKKNYKIYYDCVLAHHFPGAMNMGMPGVNGHHHKHYSWQFFSPQFGPYEWHQLGAGHRRIASYCDADLWSNGFALCNVDSISKATNFEYIPITNMAVIGGKWYHRTEEEKI